MSTKTDLRVIEEALNSFHEKYRRYPTDDEGLRALVSPPEKDMSEGWVKLIQKVPLDWWGNEYRYQIMGLDGDFRVISTGPNEKFDNGLLDDLYLSKSSYDCELFNSCLSTKHKFGFVALILSCVITIYFIGLMLFLVAKGIMKRVRNEP